MNQKNKKRKMNIKDIAYLATQLGLDTDDLDMSESESPQQKPQKKTWKDRLIEGGRYAFKKGLQVGGAHIVTNVFGEKTNQPSGQAGITLGGIQETAHENEMLAKLKEKDIMDESLYGSEDDPYNFYKGLNVRNVYKTKGGKMVDFLFSQKLEDLKEKTRKKEETISIGKGHSDKGLFGRVRKGSTGFERHTNMGYDILEMIEQNEDAYNEEGGFENMRSELKSYFASALDLVPLKSEPIGDGSGSYRLKMPSAIFETLSEKYPWLSPEYNKHIDTPELEGVTPYGVEILKRDGTDIIYRPLTKAEGDANKNHKFVRQYGTHDHAILTDDVLADIPGDESHIAASSGAFRVSKGIKDERDEIQKEIADRDGTYQKQKNIAILTDFAQKEAGSPNSIKKLAAGIIIFHPDAKNNDKIDPNRPTNVLGTINNIIAAFPHGNLIAGTVHKIKPNNSLAKELQGNEAQMKSGVDNYKKIMEILEDKGNVSITNLPGELRAFWNYIRADEAVGGLQAAPNFLDSALSKLNIPLLDDKQKGTWAKALVDKIPAWEGEIDNPNYKIYTALKDNLLQMQEEIHKGFIEGKHTAMHKIYDKLSVEEKRAFETYMTTGGEIPVELATKLGESWSQMQEIINRGKLQARLTMFIFQAAVIFQGGSGGKAVSDQDRKFVEKALQAGRFGTEEGLKAAVGEIGIVLNKIYIRTHVERRAAKLGYKMEELRTVVEPTIAILANPYAKKLLTEHVNQYRNEREHNPTQRFEDVDSQLTRLNLSLEDLADYKRGGGVI